MDRAIDTAVQDFLGQTDEEIVTELLLHQPQLQTQGLREGCPTIGYWQPQSQYQPLPPPWQLEAITIRGGPRQGLTLPPSATPSPFIHQGAQSEVPADTSPQCPVCGRTFPRPQERDRHLRAVLPHFLFCPFPFCQWRGDRPGILKAHWKAAHASFGAAPKPDECMIYDPKPLVQSVVSGELPMERAEIIARQTVEGRALELDKVGLWTDRRKRVHL